MPLHIPAGMGSAAFIVSGSAGTPNYVTTLGIDLTDAEGAWVHASDMINACYKNAFRAVMNSAYKLEDVLLTISDGTNLGSVSSSTAAWAGANSGTPAAISMAPIMRKQTTVIGRQGKGRMFLPGMLNGGAANSSGDLPSTFLATMNTAAGHFWDYLALPESRSSELFPANLLDTALPPLLFHADAAKEPTPINSFSVATKVGWIRGRIR